MSVYNCECMFKKLIISLLFILYLANPAMAQKNATYQGVITNVISEEKQGMTNLQKVEVKITNDKANIDKVEALVQMSGAVKQRKAKKGDEVILESGTNLEGNVQYYVVDFVRTSGLFWLFLIFVALVLSVARFKGLTSLIGMAFSFVVIFMLILPLINQGKDPVLVSLLSSLLIIPATFYMSHGFEKKTTVAVIGTLISLGITGLLAQVFVQATRLSGFVSEEAGFLQQMKGGEINVRGLLLAGIIIGTLGILDDVSISQAGIIDQLKKANKKIKDKELFNRAMEIGRDHIASMVNTLVLVYTGAALPLLLLFINNPHPFMEIVNYEIIAEEIVRTLVGSIGLITAVPITTILAIKMQNEK